MGLKNEYRWEEAEAKKKRKHGVEISTFYAQDFRAEPHVYCYGLVNAICLIGVSKFKNGQMALMNIFFSDFHFHFGFFMSVMDRLLSLECVASRLGR